MNKNLKLIGIYVHIPFCMQKCKYCDFASFAGCEDDTIKKYIDSLLNEIEYKASTLKNDNFQYMIDTIYIGGGTPSYINASLIKKILDTIYMNFEIKNNAEISIEINPGTITKAKLKTYKNIGINRLSIGLQSGSENILKTLGRIHNYKQYEESIKLAKFMGFTNISSDIMIGIPGQTIYDVEDTLDKLLSLDLTHISVYSLILEDGTEMTRLVNSHKLEPVDDEIERYMYWYAKRRLEENGYNHYEISNFAQPGFECKHNLNCWRQHEYIGFGLSAASYMNNTRFKNLDNLQEYISNETENLWKKNIKIEEKQTKNDKMNEYMILGLRTLKGVNLNEFENKFGEKCTDHYSETLNKLSQMGLINMDYTRYVKLTNRGLDFANIVWENFL